MKRIQVCTHIGNTIIYIDREGICSTCDEFNKLPYREEMNWISVKERLPEYDKTILLYIECEEHEKIHMGYLTHRYEDSPYHKIYFNSCCQTDCKLQPTHWMPLPEPPTE